MMFNSIPSFIQSLISMWFPLLIIGVLVYAAYRRIAYRRHLSLLTKSLQCQPSKHLSNSWVLPFGIDKWAKVIEAEKSRTYPLLMLDEHDRYGDTYTQSAGGVFYIILTRDPRNLREILVRQMKNFEIGADRAGCIAPLLGDGIFTQDGEAWANSRKLLAPLILRPPVASLDVVERHFQTLMKIIRADGVDDVVVDLQPPLLELSLAITTEFLLGPMKEEVQKARNEEFAGLFDTAYYWIAKRERLKMFHWLADSWNFRKACRKSRALVDEMIAEASRDLEKDDEEESTRQHVALTKLLQHYPDAGKVRDQFLNLLLAGRETSGGLLSWIFYALAREPELYRALKREVCDLLGEGKDRRPSKVQLSQMTTLDHFVSETLRLFPPVPINCRINIEDTAIPAGGGADGESPILVPAGTLVAFSTFATQRSKALYGPDANEFNIARWKERSVKERLADWSYHPFLGGPRKCLGERFALEQAKYMTVRFLQHFDSIEAVDPKGQPVVSKAGETWVKEVKYHVGMTMSPDEGVWLKLVPAK
jgi:cytochrome P450